MVSSHLVKVTFLGGQLFLVLLFQHLEVEIKEPLDLGGILSLQGVYVCEKLVECRKQPLVKLRPVRGKILLDEDACHYSELIIGILSEYAVVWILNERQYLCFEVFQEFWR